MSYALRKEAISEKRASFQNATENGFKVGTYEVLIPTADVVGNLTPDKQHTPVVSALLPLMKKGASLWYSHGFNIVEEGMQVRKDITVVMMAPKGPGSGSARRVHARLWYPDADRRAPREQIRAQGLGRRQSACQRHWW